MDTEHRDRARSLLPRVGVVAVADGPARRLEDRAVEIVDEAHERTLCRVAHRVVAEPRERVADRGEDRAVLLAAKRLEPREEHREGRLAVACERPEVVDERETLLRREMRDPRVETVAFEGARETEAIEASASGVREEPLRARKPNARALGTQHRAMFAHAFAERVLAEVTLDHAQHRSALRVRDRVEPL